MGGITPGGITPVNLTSTVSPSQGTTQPLPTAEKGPSTEQRIGEDLNSQTGDAVRLAMGTTGAIYSGEVLLAAATGTPSYTAPLRAAAAKTVQGMFGAGGEAADTAATAGGEAAGTAAAAGGEAAGTAAAAGGEAAGTAAAAGAAAGGEAAAVTGAAAGAEVGMEAAGTAAVACLGVPVAGEVAAAVIGIGMAFAGLGLALASLFHQKNLGDYAQELGGDVSKHEGAQNKLDKAEQKLQKDQADGASAKTIKHDDQNVEKYEHKLINDGKAVYYDDNHIELKTRTAASKLHKENDQLDKDEATLQTDEKNNASSKQLANDEKHVKKDQKHIDKTQKDLDHKIKDAQKKVGKDPTALAQFQEAVNAGLKDAADGSKSNELFKKNGDRFGNVDPLVASETPTYNDAAVNAGNANPKDVAAPQIADLGQIYLNPPSSAKSQTLAA